MKSIYSEQSPVWRASFDKALARAEAAFGAGHRNALGYAEAAAYLAEAEAEVAQRAAADKARAAAEAASARAPIDSTRAEAEADRVKAGWRRAFGGGAAEASQPAPPARLEHGNAAGAPAVSAQPTLARTAPTAAFPPARVRAAWRDAIAKVASR